MLFDVGDNVGGSSPGDSTHLLHAASTLGIGDLLRAVLTRGWYTPVRGRRHRRIEAGVGGKATTSTARRFRSAPPSPPCRTVVTAKTGADPRRFRFFNDGPVRRAHRRRLLLLTRQQPRAQQPATVSRTGHRTDTDKEIMRRQGVHSPRPALEPISNRTIWVASPGVTSADLSTFTYLTAGAKYTHWSWTRWP
jgi:microcystin degradation protein MlrC